jgi:LemA protein
LKAGVERGRERAQIRARQQGEGEPLILVYVLIGAAVFVGAAVLLIYNDLVGKRQMTNNGWADIDVQLKRRADLVPRLVEAVKGYAAHERALFEDVAEKRAAALAAGDDPKARAAAEQALAGPLGRMIAVAEDYPTLKASENFLALQVELADTEDSIEMARRFYNGAVRELNTAIGVIPGNLVAGAAGFGPRAYFEIDAADRAAPKVEDAVS